MVGHGVTKSFIGGTRCCEASLQGYSLEGEVDGRSDIVAVEN